MNNNNNSNNDENNNNSNNNDNNNNKIIKIIIMIMIIIIIIIIILIRYIHDISSLMALDMLVSRMLVMPWLMLVVAMTMVNLLSLEVKAANSSLTASDSLLNHESSGKLINLASVLYC